MYNFCRLNIAYTHTHTHTYIYIYMFGSRTNAADRRAQQCEPRNLNSLKLNSQIQASPLDQLKTPALSKLSKLHSLSSPNLCKQVKLSKLDSLSSQNLCKPSKLSKLHSQLSKPMQTVQSLPNQRSLQSFQFISKFHNLLKPSSLAKLRLLVHWRKLLWNLFECTRLSRKNFRIMVIILP